MKRKWVVPWLVALALVVLASRRPGSGVTTKLTGVAPTWEMRDLAGKPVRSSDFSGRVVILNFWATWCPPCRREIPDFVEFARTHDTNRVVVIGASIDESIEAVRSFQKSAAIPYPVVSVDGLTRLAFGGIEGVPTTFVIDAQGRFVSRTLGPMTARQLEGAVEAAQEVVSQPSTTP